MQKYVAFIPGQNTSTVVYLLCMAVCMNATQRYWKSVKKIGRILSDVFVLTLSVLVIILIVDFVYALIGVRLFGGL